MSDNTTNDCTASATWTSSATAVATMSGATATGVTAGTATISAASSGIIGSATLTVTPAPTAHVINHIVFMAQENRSFDSYFGMLNAYRVAQGLPADVDGLPGSATGTVTPDCTNHIACNKGFQTGAAMRSYHYITACTDNMSPSWNESHIDFNLENFYSMTAKNDGFAYTAGGFAISQSPPLWDVDGMRAMGYYTERELPYYYFMATQFATSDRFFAPAPTRSQANRLYLFAATSHGHVYEPTLATGGQLPVPTIFDLLQNASITWKIYYSDVKPSDKSPDTYFYNFTSANKLASGHLFPVTQYYTDLQNNALPQVSFIESGYLFGLDEHPENDVQTGAVHVSKLMNALMASSSWMDSVFFLTYDEAGALYDHVSPMLPVPSPDGIKPTDLNPLTNDICLNKPNDPACDFTRTGFRLPVLVVSPFTKPHYVSHTPMDFTAILKFIETRFNLPNLTKRDAAQPPMDEFFDYSGAPNATPPTPPIQPGQDCDGLTRTCKPSTLATAPCYADHLP